MARGRRPAAPVAATLAVALAVLWARSAEAYLDPSASSMFLQLLVASIAAALVAVKAFWHRIAAFLARQKRGSGDGTDQPS